MGLMSISQQQRPAPTGSTTSSATDKSRFSLKSVCLSQRIASQEVSVKSGGPALPVENLINQLGWMGNLGIKATSKQKGSGTAHVQVSALCSSSSG